MTLFVLILLVTFLQGWWCVEYMRSSWRQTPLGWVWLLKGSVLELAFIMNVLSFFVVLPEFVYVMLGFALVISIGIWTGVTRHARINGLTTRRHAASYKIPFDRRGVGRGRRETDRMAETEEMNS